MQAVLLAVEGGLEVWFVPGGRCAWDGHVEVRVGDETIVAGMDAFLTVAENPELIELAGERLEAALRDPAWSEEPGDVEIQIGDEAIVAGRDAFLTLAANTTLVENAGIQLAKLLSDGLDAIHEDRRRIDTP